MVQNANEQTFVVKLIKAFGGLVALCIAIAVVLQGGAYGYSGRFYPRDEYPVAYWGLIVLNGAVFLRTWAVVARALLDRKNGGQEA